MYVLCATLCSQVKLYEKRMPPKRDGKGNHHRQELQTRKWFKKHVHHGKKQWGKAKPEEDSKRIWFYMDDDGKETEYTNDDGDDGDDDDDDSEEAPPPVFKCKSCKTVKSSAGANCPNPSCDKHTRKPSKKASGSPGGTSVSKKAKVGDTDRTREQNIEKKKVLGHMKLMWKGIKSGWFPVIHATNLFDNFGELYTELTGDSFDHNAPKWPGN
jgi:hypothetical protein